MNRIDIHPINLESVLDAHVNSLVAPHWCFTDLLSLIISSAILNLVLVIRHKLQVSIAYEAHFR